MKCIVMEKNGYLTLIKMRIRNDSCVLCNSFREHRTKNVPTCSQSISKINCNIFTRLYETKREKIPHIFITKMFRKKFENSHLTRNYNVNQFTILKISLEIRLYIIILQQTLIISTRTFNFDIIFEFCCKILHKILNRKSFV